MPNRLAQETSPYLLQHRDNPVDWYPWGEEAHARARAENKPILLSIGYSACHWCHVMAHESFEDEATARVMNELYVNIKLDREERPDLDRIYQLAHQALAQRGGGWPLTVFLSPEDHLPFFAGTYFPREARHGLPPFAHVLQRVREWYDQQPGQLREQTALLKRFLDEHGRGAAAPESVLLDAAPIARALHALAQQFDARHGGFGRAPKFPHAGDLELMLASGRPAPGSVAARDDSTHADMARATLARMAEGGIHDQIGGGFCRYSVDERWEIPHFEKMLYDNAQLLPLYAEAARDNGNAEFAAVAHGVVAWLSREMTHPAGGFHAALDADSEHEEGKFYVWQREEVRALLEPDEFAVVERHYGFYRPPNFEGHAWNPIIAHPLDRVARELGASEQDAARRLASARDKLFAHRATRVRPGLDDKILTSWNALMIAGLARAGRALEQPAWASLAAAAVDFLHDRAWRDGRLYASWKQGQARFPAYLDDHAFLLDALLEVLQTRWWDRDFAWALALADQLLERFEDRERGGFWFTAHDHEALATRQKPWFDESVPSGNGVAARALLRLGHLTGETRYSDAGSRALHAAWPALGEAPHGCAALLLALREHLEPPRRVVIRTDAAGDARGWREIAARLRLRGEPVYVIPEGAAALPESLDAQRVEVGGVAYVCEGMMCLAPIDTPDELAALL